MIAAIARYLSEGIVPFWTDNAFLTWTVGIFPLKGHNETRGEITRYSLGKKIEFDKNIFENLSKEINKEDSIINVE